jgi:hypothetical protein
MKKQERNKLNISQFVQEIILKRGGWLDIKITVFSDVMLAVLQKFIMCSKKPVACIFRAKDTQHIWMKKRNVRIFPISSS